MIPLPAVAPAQFVFYAKCVAAALLAGALIWFGYWLGGLKPGAELASAKSDHALQIAEWNRLSAAGARRALDLQTQHQAAADAARTTLDATLRDLDQQVARLRTVSVDRDRLRRQIDAYAAGAGGADAGSTCLDRAAVLGGLLAEGAQLLVEGRELAAACGLAHDRRAAEVRALIEAWPR